MHPPVRAPLDEDGPIAGALGPAYEARPEQAEMAAAVERAFDSRGVLLVEAGTGVGKSFAYLVPAMLRCMLRRERVVIATNTIALQEQLVRRDVPFLASTIGSWGLPEDRAALSPALVKGRGNYLSMRRLKLASARQATVFADAAQRRSLHVIEDWAYRTTDGTLSALPPLERPGVWDRVQSDSNNCMGRKCPTYDACFYQNSRREMERANLLICNHALFFSDLALRARGVGFLPAYDHVVLDEAHNAEDVASDHFGVSLAEGRCEHLLGTLYHQRTGKGYLSQLRLEPPDDEALDSAHRAVLDADAASDAFFRDVWGLLESGRLPGGRVPAAPENGEPVVADTLSPAFSRLALRLRMLKESAADPADAYELNAYAARAEAIAADASGLCAQSIPGSVYWVESTGSDDGHASRGRRGRRLKLSCSPIEVAPLLRRHLFSRAFSVVLTSATLATRTRGGDEPLERAETAFSHAINRLGCDGSPPSPPSPTGGANGDGGDSTRSDDEDLVIKGPPATLQLGSPFEYASQVELLIDLNVGNPRGAAGGRPPDRLAERVLHHLEATGGGAFVLFTSFASLEAVANALEDPLARAGMPMLVQGRGVPRGQLLERFRASERSVLLGAASFWQGVDVRGSNLRNVVITRLPFEPPDRPLTQARLERIEERGGNPFMEDSLPRAIIRFKQGFGRLIRSRSDVGRVVVLDPRIVTARYGRMFLAALPPGVPVRTLGPNEE